MVSCFPVFSESDRASARFSAPPARSTRLTILIHVVLRPGPADVKAMLDTHVNAAPRRPGADQRQDRSGARRVRGPRTLRWPGFVSVLSGALITAPTDILSRDFVFQARGARSAGLRRPPPNPVTSRQCATTTNRRRLRVSRRAQRGLDQGDLQLQGSDIRPAKRLVLLLPQRHARRADQGLHRRASPRSTTPRRPRSLSAAPRS